MTKEKKLDEIAKFIDEALLEVYGHNMGFALFMFPFDGVGVAGDYVSNGKKPDMIKFMREIADRLEAGETIGRTIGSA